MPSQPISSISVNLNDLVSEVGTGSLFTLLFAVREKLMDFLPRALVS